MKTATAALLGFALAGCAPAGPTMTARGPIAPVSQWQEDGAGEAIARSMAEHLAAARSESGVAPVESEAAPSNASAAASLEPEVIHRARIEMAREALVDENAGKEQVDLAEELQRELAALQESSEASKSRARHGRTKKK